MPLVIKAYANADDVLVAWNTANWDDTWVGFKLERRDTKTGVQSVIMNRIPPQAGADKVPDDGIPSDQSPIRRCIWTDHSVASTDSVSYRVTAMRAADNGFTADEASSSDWTEPLVASGDAGDGLAAYFNRGTLMSQVVSRFVHGDMTLQSLHKFADDLKTPGFPARRYLSGDARHQILTFLGEADRRQSEIYAAIYEINDVELIDALKPFGSRGHILIGNGDGTDPEVGSDLERAGLEVHHRDLSHAGRSSPSVHNKFVVEVARGTDTGAAVLTGSTNWTVTGLCTQLNNVLIAQRPKIADRYLNQWKKLVAAGDDMPEALRAANSDPTQDAEIELYFAATTGQAEFQPVLEAIKNAKQGALFAMFMPGNSPLLSALLDRAQENEIYVRGVVSRVVATKTGDIVQVEGQVVKSGPGSGSFHRDVLIPSGITDKNKPAWVESEFTAQEMLANHMMAIVHSKAIVIDPLSPDCVVITGSHNFSPNASEKNDENLIIIRGNQKLAQAYALHLTGVYDHYSWRNYLQNNGDPNSLYTSLDGWKPGGSRAQELNFWMS
ncbi:phospholipase D-like domain-containing protein [Mesorhizobium sp. M1B.F.Ca.ET.045.04.1.1]|uniref:phospholipase D-like domain-containing protein n=1 Tax=Mesorhizobium sp. M1B.F.Ca.ET.045.04.1.1 TaxID=2493673 RepID=UPI000F7529BA|nr:phospholipase D-like domain-containing protein [Mesorhizobium sp. M1B.F.Ca.ET.045.04.1.1]AZO32397.1 phospholipase [Mesorhizobium sp. M1B.F.Ca.ET.045.04.1.1]